jgi:hypothetical protein
MKFEKGNKGSFLEIFTKKYLLKIHIKGFRLTIAFLCSENLVLRLQLLLFELLFGTGL